MQIKINISIDGKIYLSNNEIMIGVGEKKYNVKSLLEGLNNAEDGSYTTKYTGNSVTEDSGSNEGGIANNSSEEINPIVNASNTYLNEITSDKINIRIGANQSFIGPEFGDWYVDSENGSDTNSGSNIEPFKTVSHAINISNNLGGTVLARGEFEETVSFYNKTFPKTLILTKWGSDKFIITGGKTFTGWERCGLDEFPNLGSTYSKVHKITIPKSELDLKAVPISSMIVHENNKMLNICYDRKGVGDSEYFHTDRRFYHTANTFILDAAGNIEKIVSPTIFGQYTPDQIKSSDIWYYSIPNKVTQTNIIDYDSVLSAAIINPKTGPWSGKYLFQLTNILANIKKGQYGVRETVDSVIVYCYPENEEHLSNRMRISIRNCGIDLNNASNITIRGVTVREIGGTGGPSGIGIGKQGRRYQESENITVEECIVEDCYTNQTNYAAISMTKINNLKIVRNTVRNKINGGGLFISNCSNTLIRENLVYGVDNTPISIFGSGESRVNITAVEQTSPAIVTAPNHKFIDGDSIYFRDINGPDLLKKEAEKIYYVGRSTNDQFSVYHDRALTKPADNTNGLPLDTTKLNMVNMFNRTECKNMIIAFNHFELASRSTHANKCNIYLYVNNFLVYGNRWVNVNGYFTWQQSSNMIYAMNENWSSGIEGDNRALVDQQGYMEPELGCTNYIYNNTTHPDPNELTNGHAWVVGSSHYVSSKYHLINNIFPGGGRQSKSNLNQYTSQKNNLITVGGMWYGQHLDESDILETGLGMYKSVETGEFIEGSTPYTMEGMNMQELIDTVFKVRFPEFEDFDKDVDGNLIDWNKPFVGSKKLI